VVVLPVFDMVDAGLGCYYWLGKSSVFVVVVFYCGVVNVKVHRTPTWDIVPVFVGCV
jgi:hypothetical protein